MTKTLYTFLIAGLFFYSCGSAEQMQQDTDTSESSGQTLSENSAPSWYNHAQRSYLDSTEFAGTGMAIASDSLLAVEKSVVQARKFLEYSIDSYAEDARQKLTDEATGSDMGSAKFVLLLRQAVNNLQFSETDVTIDTDHSLVEGSIHRVYSRVSLDRNRAIDMLASAVGNDLFSRTLREESGM